MSVKKHNSDKTVQTHIWLVNLGSPDKPEKAAVKRYLKRFLSDPRVIKNTGILWKVVLNAIILPLRSGKVAEKYREIWLPEGAPLPVYTRRLMEKLAAHRPNCQWAHAMVYGEPLLQQRLAETDWKAGDKLLVMAMYPQYSGTTFDPIRDQIDAHFAANPQKQRPEIAYVQDYATHPFYIKALADSVRTHWQRHGQGQKLLLSFHGLPQEYIDAGDPYAERCRATAHALAGKLGLAENQWQLAWQSQFGPRQWLEPKTDAVLTRWAREGVSHVDVLCPGFSTDGLETLEEIDMQYRQAFLQAGGKRFAYIPALNDSEGQVLLYEQLLAQNLPDAR